MGCVIKLIDAVLFLFFLLIALLVPLFDAQICLPQEYYPKALLDLSSWYSNEYGDYLVVEKPNFFVGLVWLELFVIWPLSIVNLFGLLSAKSWFNTTCLIYGASITTSMVKMHRYFEKLAQESSFPSSSKFENSPLHEECGNDANQPQQPINDANTNFISFFTQRSRIDVAILSELIQSSKASEKLLMVYYPFLGLAVLAVLRGLLPASCKTATFSKRPVPARKKRA